MGQVKQKIKYINFSKTVNLKEIRSMVTENEGAFVNNGIIGISFGNLKQLNSIGNYAFATNRFETLTLGTGLTTIDNLAFNNNDLQKLYIPNNVVSIANDAFNNSNLYLTFNVDKVSDEIPNSPWGAGYSKVNWLR